MNSKQAADNTTDPLIRTVGIVAHLDGLTGSHQRLVSSLSTHSLVLAVKLLVLPARHTGLPALVLRLSQWIDQTVMRQRRPRVDTQSLADGHATVLAVTPETLNQTVVKNKIDLLIDLRGTPVDAGLLSAARDGVVQIVCNGAPDDFNFGAARLHKGHPEESAVNLLCSGRTTPVARYGWWHAPSGGHLLYDRELLANRAISLIMRLLRGAPPTSPDAFPGLTTASAGTWPGPVAMAGRSMAAVVSTLLARLRWLSKPPDQWFMAGQRDPGHFITRGKPLERGQYQTVLHDPKHFYADPMVIERHGSTHVFFEDYAYSRKKGVIVHSVVRSDGRLSPPEPVLDLPYHLSYPFVFEHGGQVYMVPESSANLTVDLYRANDFPTHWVHECTLLSGVNAVDATLHHDGSGWWMFVNIGEYGSCTNDELCIFRAEQLTGPWQPHAANPVKTGLSDTRPAGALFQLDGRLIRPAQDCSRLYGGGLVFNAIDQLSMTTFSEHVVQRFDPSMLDGCDGLHTVSASATFEIIDARRTGT